MVHFVGFEIGLSRGGALSGGCRGFEVGSSGFAFLRGRGVVGRSRARGRLEAS